MRQGSLTHYMSHEFNYAFFGPVTFFAGPLGNETAVTAVLRRNESDRRALFDIGPKKSFVGNERIVLCGH